MVHQAEFDEILKFLLMVAQCEWNVPVGQEQAKRCPRPGYALLIHFKSKDLGNLFKFGHFWHLFIYNQIGLHAAAISQNDEDIFTTHLLLPLDADNESIDSHDAVYRALGGMGPPFRIEIDEILVRSAYRHSIAVARTYRSSYGKIYLAGDSAHQNIPTGGYGMNMVSPNLTHYLHVLSLEADL